MGPLVEGTRADEVAQWGARPRTAFVAKALAVLTPVIASVMATIAVTKIVPRPTNVIALVAWWVGLTALATLVAVLVERLARRLLPLASLLRLSAAFPDEAPSRFAVVLRTHSATRLEETLDQARLTGEPVDDAPAAEYLLELLVRLNTHDRWTRGHADRVSAYAELIAVELGLPEPVREQLRWSALLHDIGKLDLPAGLLNLTRRPTAIERRALERHVTEGEALTRSMTGWLGDSLRRGRRTPRTVGRQRVSAAVGGGTDLPGRAHRRRGRCLRRDDGGEDLPGACLRGRGAVRAHPRRRCAVRPERGARLPQRLPRAPAPRDGAPHLGCRTSPSCRTSPWPPASAQSRRPSRSPASSSARRRR